jgi:hypothetical protein
MYKIILVILIILIVYIFVYHYGIEKYTERQYDLDRDIIPRSSTYIESESIESPIPDAYLTYYMPIDDEQIHNIYDYIIIRNYRHILGRPPTSKEIKIYRYKLLTGETDETFMITLLYNSLEYEYMKETQLNVVEYELEFETYKRMLFEILRQLYFKYHNEDVYDNMLPVLRSILIHLQFDMYLYIACLSSEKYKPFEIEVLETVVMNKYVLREIFYKHFILLELHNRANAIKQEDLKDGKSDIFSLIFDGQKLQENKDREDAIRAKEEAERRRLAENAKGPKCEIKLRTKKIYNPITHNMPYTTKIAHNPPVCTTLGNKYNYKEYENNKYTTIKESINTDVGSIMQKFEYNEYVEVDY